MAGHSHVCAPGFTLVELIVVMVLVGILGAIGATRFFDRTGFDADAFTEQVRTMLRHAQKVAIAQNRTVFVSLQPARISLCFEASAACPAASQVQSPAATRSSSAASRASCGETPWYCEAPPAGLSYTSGPVAMLGFDALGRPLDPSSTQPFQQLTLTIKGGGADRLIQVTPETGYVY